VLASIIVLHVASAEVDTATTGAIARALDQAMDAAGTVSIRALSGSTPAPDLSAACGEAGVTGAATVVWAAAERQEATVQVRHCATGETSRFRLSFASGDPTAERGRSVGFVIASALHTAAPPPVLDARAPPASPAPPTPAQRPVVALTAQDPPRSPVTRGRALEALLLVGVPLGGDGDGIGGGLAGRLAGPRGWGARLGLQARSGQINAAQASIFEAGLTTGVTYTVHPEASGLTPAVGLRLDVSLLYEAITHFSSDDPDPVRRQRLFPGGAGMVELTWPLGPLDLHLGTGLQVAFAVADVLVRGIKVAEIPAWRATVEAGFRVDF
jgi:hypothetical protein